MSIQTVATILTDIDGATEQLDAAIGFARAMDAHLQVLALAIGIDQTGMVQTALDAVPTAYGVADSIEQARSLADHATAKLADEDIRWNVDPIGVTSSASGREIAHHVRFSDLVIQQQRSGSAHHDTTRMLAETILFDADTPLLLLPEATAIMAPPRKIMVSWDESAAALRAARYAMPILTAASHVHVVLVDPPKDAPDRSDPGGAFAQYLSRHGIKCEVSVCNQMDKSISATLEHRAQELGCEMIVMGAYGRSRLRQAIFGGTTRDMLTRAQTPVFMAH